MLSSTLKPICAPIGSMTFADRIREAMGQRSPAQLAREVGVTQSAVSQWLDGKVTSLNGETPYKLEVVTGYRAAWLVTGKGQKKSNALAWPFEAISQERWEALSLRQQILAEDAMLQKIRQLEEEQTRHAA